VSKGQKTEKTSKNTSLDLADICTKSLVVLWSPQAVHVLLPQAYRRNPKKEQPYAAMIMWKKLPMESNKII
jgi:hypothetical protein